ncbi:succinate dehydrogenase (quinone) flavoprotein subunit [Marichromatium gracile]|uniref:succinate dehydrogenase (quinone) flavoprotein subunit n=1 Tax=Marichromatium gracile TaxID=1048 RepID=UPI001F26D8E7|nr:succinate dehydrogenase (quinone) flavoprotein subunit [Marichromatium gracile]MCF1183861.1 succinate dehydrogenase (quinone) flavoprotein subunit [Marichromatium gracile]
MSAPGAIVVGGGLGGLWASLRLAEAGFPVRLFSLFEVKRSHSVCAQGGINAVLDTKGERDSIEQHILDTIKGGEYLANQPPIKSLCEQAPGLIRTFARMGVTFSRTPEGGLDLRLFGGVKHRRTCFAGASTGQQLLYGVDQQVRRLESLGQVEKFEWWEFLSLLIDADGRCRGILAMDLRSLEVRAFPADTVVLASGGFGQLYAPKTTTSTNSTGAAASRVYQQGAWFANGEFFQFHPTAMLGHDKTRLMSEAARGEGGRVWVPRDPGDRRDPRRIPERERFYFLEEFFPAYGNTVARDEASRAIWRVTRELGLGIGGGDRVYLDLTHLDRRFVATRLGAILEIYRKFAGSDPLDTPMEIFPAAHYGMGGLWVDFERDADGGMRPGSARNHATNIPGLYACGECDYAYHGANRLGANSLLSASFSGRVAGEAAANYLRGLDPARPALAETVIEAERRRQETINQRLLSADGEENPYTLHQALGALMTERVGVVRDNAGLEQALAELDQLEARLARIGLGEANRWANQTLIFTRQLADMIVLAKAVTASALARDECRGAHHKPAFELPIPEGSFPGDPEFEDYRARWRENNTRWLKTTLAEYAAPRPRIHYQAVDLSVCPPSEPRDYR